MISTRETKTVLWEDEYDEYHYIQANEWWNGEGLDFTISGKDGGDIRIGLHIEELNQIARIAAQLGYIDLKEIKNDLKQSKGSSRSGN